MSTLVTCATCGAVLDLASVKWPDALHDADGRINPHFIDIDAVTGTAYSVFFCPVCRCRVRGTPFTPEFLGNALYCAPRRKTDPAQPSHNDFQRIIALFKAELIRARGKFPEWPTDPIYAASILVEEAGETLKEANNFMWGNGDKDAMITEAVQTGAMAIRFLLNVAHYHVQPGAQRNDTEDM